MPNLTKIEISTGTFLRAILLILGFVFLYFIRDVVAVILFSVVIASAVEPAAQWFMRYRLPRVLGVLLVYIIVFSLVASAFSLIIPPLFAEISAVSSESLIKSASGAFFNIAPQLPASISGVITGFIENSRVYVEKLAGGFFQATSALFGGALSFILIVVISFYLSVQERGIEGFLKIVVPLEYERYVLDLWSRVRRKMGSWMQSQILLGVLVGVLVFIGLTILQIKFALSLAIIAAIFEILPVFGPILAAIPAVLLAFLQSPALGLMVIIFYFIVQQFENHLIVPVLFKKAVGVPPILVVLALIVGGKLGGFFGLLLAVPVAVVLVEFLNDIAARKQIG
ncbi:MAG: AI-2E family transporter [Candidatus Niyogibacteria bacterium]|nr:MAG: AI-2E family transporter [Candidatus Niyogibacteria bacterium]